MTGAALAHATTSWESSTSGWLSTATVAVVVVDVDDDRRVGLEVALVVGAEGGDDDLVAGPGQVGGGAVDLHRARARLAVDHVGDEAGAVVDVPDVDLLVGDQVGARHQLGVDRDAADVVDVAVGHRRPVDLGLEHLPLHQFAPPCRRCRWAVRRLRVRPIGGKSTLSISRAPPTWAATATRTGRPFSSATGSKLSASRASRYSGSIPAASSSRRPASSAGGERVLAGDPLDRAQRPRERRRPLAVRRAEVGVARAHRQAVGLAHDRQRLDPHREVEVAHHAADRPPPAGRPSGRSRRRRAGRC